MLSIKEFFKKIQGTRAKEYFIRSVVVAAVKKYSSVDVPIEAVSFSSSDVVLKGINQTARSVIFTKRTEIIKEINTVQSDRIITDIR